MKTKILLAALVISAFGFFPLAAQENAGGTAAKTAQAAKTAKEKDDKPSKSNMTVREWKVDAATNQKMLDHVTVFNENGRKVEEIEYDSNGQKWRKRYEHGANGKVAVEYVYNHANKLDNYRKFEFDEFGRKKTEYIYDAKGKLKRYKVYEYIPGGNE